MSAKYSFGRISDAAVIDLLNSLIELFKVSSSSVSIGDLTSYSISKNDDGITGSEGKAVVEELFSEDSYLITSMSWNTANSSYSVVYHRQKVWGLNPNNNPTWIESPNRYIDSVEVNASSQYAPMLLDVIRKHINMAPPIAVSAEGETALDQSQEILNRVSAAVATLVEHTADRQKELDATRTSISREADKIIKANRTAAAEEVKQVEAQYAEKVAALAERESELDDRANTHVRREFAEKMASLSDTQLQSNLLTKSTKSFWVPLALCVGPVIILALIVFQELSFIEQFSKDIGQIATDSKFTAEQRATLIGNVNYQILYAQIRIVLQSLGIAALVWFALRLASSRYSLVSGWERDLHRFRLDTERAGFLVEGDLEARKVNQEGLPDVLLESFSRNLFSSSDSAHGPTSKEGLGGALNALLGQAAKVRVGPEGVNVEVEGRGIRKARKLIEEDE